jgi:hypothetical protein
VASAAAGPMRRGRVTETPLEEWLDRTGASPENAALRSLLERSDATGRTK